MESGDEEEMIENNFYDDESNPKDIEQNSSNINNTKISNTKPQNNNLTNSNISQVKYDNTSKISSKQNPNLITKINNSNPPACVLKVRMRNPDDFTSSDVELLNGWKEWSLEDIIHRLNSAKWSACLGASGPFGEIVFLKLLEAANNPNIPFELIEKVVHITLRTRVDDIVSDNVFGMAGLFEGKQIICDFFKEFIKHGKNDDRYYNLIYEMLTYQTVEDTSLPLGYQIRKCTGWEGEVFAKLPAEIQEQLSGESFYANKGDTCYSLLSDASLGM